MKTELTHDQVYCSECGERRTKTKGAMGVCPNGHGKLVPGFTAGALRRFDRAMATQARIQYVRQFPEASRRRCHVIAGVGTAEWHGWANATHTREWAEARGFVLARVGDRLGVFRVIDAKD